MSDVVQNPGQNRRTDANEEGYVEVPAGGVTLRGNLLLPEGARGCVVFAHGSGSGRFSPRNRHVAELLREAGLGTLLVDLLTREEEAVDLHTAHLRFDIRLLADRLLAVTDWLNRGAETRQLTVGYFGSSTGGGAALVAAAARPERVFAVVSRGGRPDLAGSALVNVEAPTLLIVGSRDHTVLSLNEEAFAVLECEKDLKIVHGATHLFEEPGALEEVAGLAAGWFARFLGTPEREPEAGARGAEVRTR